MPNYASDSTTEATWAQLIAAVAAKACGIEPEALFREAGIEPGRWHSQRRITQPDITALWQTAARLSGRPDIGLDIMDHFHFHALGPLGYELMSAATLREAAQDLFRHSPLVSQTWSFILSEQDGVACVTVEAADPDVTVTHHSYDAIMASSICFARDWLTHGQLEFSAAHFAHPDFGLDDHYQQQLGCACRFDAGSYELRFDATYLDLPMPGADADLHQALDSRLEREAAELTGISGQVEAALLTLIRGSRKPLRPAVASLLGMAQRTLLRRLAEEGETFQSIANRVFVRLASEWLAEGQPTDMVAERLGYGDAAALGKMLKRRTGKGVRELRKRK